MSTVVSTVMPGPDASQVAPCPGLISLGLNRESYGEQSLRRFGF